MLLKKVKLLEKIKGAFFLFVKSFLKAVAYTLGIVIVLFIVFTVVTFLNPVLSYKGEAYAFVINKKLQKIGENYRVVDVDDMMGEGDVVSLKQLAVLSMNGLIMPTCYNLTDICPSRVEVFLNYVKTNKNIYGLVISLNSPGGEVYASEEIYQAITEVAKVKPVFVYAESEVASGAYYISMGANKIYANPVSVLGSIGVYWEVYNYDGLLQKLGIKHTYLVSSNAKYKIESNWLFKDDKEGKLVKKQLQEVVDETEKVFWKRIKESRPEAKFESLHGLVVSANKAYKLGLIDGIFDNVSDVYLQMAKSLNLSRDVYVVNYSLEYPSTGLATIKHIGKKLKILNGGTDVYLMYK